MDKKDVTEKDAKRLKEAVVQLSKLVSNSICADCHQHRSLWASVNFGVFLCSRCAGMHRHLGVHVTQVRSINLDTWTPTQLFAVILNGNMWTNAWLLSKTRTPDFGRQFGDDSAMSRFIQEKYEYSKYGDNTGILLVTKTNFSNVTVERALEVFKLAMQLHRQKLDHSTIRPMLIKAAGYNYPAPTHNPANRKLLLIMDEPSGGLNSPITQAHISGIPQPKIASIINQQTPVQKAAVKVEKLIDLDDFTDFASAPVVEAKPVGNLNTDYGISNFGVISSGFPSPTTVTKSNSSKSFATFPKQAADEADWPTTGLSTSGSVDFMPFSNSSNNPNESSFTSASNAVTNDFGNLTFATKTQTENKHNDLFSIGNGKALNDNVSNIHNGNNSIIGEDFLNFALNQDTKQPVRNTSASTNSMENFLGSITPASSSTNNFVDILGSPVMAPTPFEFDTKQTNNGNVIKNNDTGANKGQDLDFILGLYNK